MNLLDQSVIKKGKSAAAPRDAAPGRAPLLPSGLPRVGIPPRQPSRGAAPLASGRARCGHRRDRNESGGSRRASASILPRPDGLPRAVPRPWRLPVTGDRGARTDGPVYRDSRGQSRRQPRTVCVGSPGTARRGSATSPGAPGPAAPDRSPAPGGGGGSPGHAPLRTAPGGESAERARSVGFYRGEGRVNGREEVTRQ